MTDHAMAGAQELYRGGNRIGAYCISGHHSRLLDEGTEGDSGGEGTFSGRMKKQVDNYQSYENEVQLPVFPNPPLRQLGKGGFSLSFFTECCFPAWSMGIFWIPRLLCLWKTFKEADMILWSFFWSGYRHTRLHGWTIIVRML